MKKAIFITGASAGIGKATAELFARKGWFVGITDADEAGLRELKGSLGDGIGYSATLDVTDAERVAAVLGEFNRAAGGRFDVLFNNAGVLRVKYFEAIPLKEHHAIVDVNNKGILNCTHHAFPYLKECRDSRVINMASVASLVATPTQTTYSASKFWVRGFTEALNIEWERHGIHVCDIMPNYVRTPMLEQNPGEIVDNVGIFLSAQDVAETVWRAAAEKRIHWVVDRPRSKLLLSLLSVMPYSIKRRIVKRKAGL
jgi:short-subunit dehydrogenase